jgi:Holliday junction resolvase RusA-like endonuclease
MNEAILPAPSSYVFTVPGKPVQWQRARRNGDRYFTAKRQAKYQQAVAWEAKAARVPLMTGAVAASITFHLQIPKRTPKRDRAAMVGAPALIHVDTDNLAKGILDALNGIAYEDDCQVYDLRATKVWADVPCAVVALEGMQ